MWYCSAALFSILSRHQISVNTCSFTRVTKKKMVDVVLIVTSVIFAILILIASVYFVVYFQHPDDTNVALFPKIITVRKSLR